MRSMMRRLALVAACAAPALLCAQTVDPPARSLPPPEDFYKLPAYKNVTLSPDGRRLAALIPIKGRTNLALIDLDKRTASALTGQTRDDVISYRWLGERVIEATTADLDEVGGVTTLHQHVLIDVTDQSLLRDLQRIARAGIATVINVVGPEGTDLIVQTIDRNVYSLDAYRFNANTGEKQLLTVQSPGDVQEFVADHNGQVRIAVSIPRGGARRIVWYRRSNDDKWTKLRDDPASAPTFDPIDFDFDDRTLYVKIPVAEHGGRASVFKFDTETGEVGERVFEAKSVDAGSVIPDWTQRKMVGVADGSPDGVHWLDPQWLRLQRSIDEALPNAHNSLTWARFNADRVIVRSETETQPPEYFLLDRKTMRLEPVATSYPWLKEDALSPRKAVHYKARDGLTIPAYLTIPKRPDGAKAPLIVVIHGGPFAPGYNFGFDADSQFFASRGYAVLEPNFRGTQGYGAAFEKSGWRQWGLAMQDDVTDGVRWLVDSGQVDGDRVCLYGASYGGYATLWGLEKEPTMFRCGIAFLAVSDLELLFDDDSDFMRSERGGDATEWLRLRLGDPSTGRDQLRAVSPDRHADRVQAPLLLAYGANDQRVPITHGTRMRSALDDAHKPYEWVLYNDQQHMRFDPVNGADFYRRVDTFLATNLKPRKPVDAQAVAAPQ